MVLEDEGVETVEMVVDTSECCQQLRNVLFKIEVVSVDPAGAVFVLVRLLELDHTP